MTSDNEIVKVINTKAIASAQSPIGMNIAILRNMYDIHIRNVNVCQGYKQAMHQLWSTVDVIELQINVSLSLSLSLLVMHNS